MKHRNFLYLLIALIIAVASMEGLEALALSAASPAGLEAPAAASKKKSSKKNKKSGNKKNSKNKKKSGSNKKKSSRSKNKSGNSKRKSRGKSRRNVARSVYKAPPKEQPLNDSLTLAVNRAVLSNLPKGVSRQGLRINSVKTDRSRRIANVGLNEDFTYLTVTKNLIDSISRTVSATLPDSISNYRVNLNVGNRSLSYYIRRVDKLPEKYRKNPPFVKEVHPMVVANKGMENDIVALWHSHGRYFKPGSGSWMWQRPSLFQSIEDTYTMSYILPFVTPMLENAGAYVMLPRERDTNVHEVIVDNDTNDEGQIFSQPYYKEKNGARQWVTGEGEGFIYDLPDFRDTENPFENGTYRQTTTQKGGSPSVAAWYADIPEDGEYAVYVSYKTLENSTPDAHYTVNYSGGSKEFTVNQTMGGGTWIYLGTFPLEAGYSDTEPVVTLTNITAGAPGTVVTADAVKIGGGMGNIARSNRRRDIYYDPSTPDNSTAQAAEEEESEEDEEAEDSGDDDDSSEGDDETSGESDDIGDTAEQPLQTSAPEQPAQKKGPAPTFRTSGYPRYLEGARYWLHWAGFPEYVYSPYHGRDDYKDDYTSRGHWVNYLAGGSRVLPGREGLNIPIDATFALHSDAGKRSDDSVVGTLGIYFTQNGSDYIDGTPRINSRMLCDMVMESITRDVRAEFETDWTRRQMWDKSYVEARVPEVPTTLIELLSHQNFRDMQYGLDPTFRFTVSRAIYKGIARFLAERKGRALVIQPLPVKDFLIKRSGKDRYRLECKPTPDRLESTAMPDKYVIMERSGDDLGFHKIGETKSTHFDIKVTDHDIHSFRVIAVNQGGASFPSETLALREAPDGHKPIMIVNGFTRVSGPGHFSADGRAGFDSKEDFGVPYIKDNFFTGYQTEFRRSAGEGFGRSDQNYINKEIAGNTFDYPAVHGASAMKAGLGFVSASAAAVESGAVKLSDYPVVDLILGKQKATVVGRGQSGVKFTAFPKELQKQLRHYTDKGGRLLVSGEYVASDLTNLRSDETDRTFARDVLGLAATSTEENADGRLRDARTGKTSPYSNTLNEHFYIVESPDILTPAPEADTTTIMTFASSENAAAQLTDLGRGKVVVMSVPLETITDEAQRDAIFATLLKSLEK